MTKKPPPLPGLIATVVAPDAFHPSSFAQLERCPLSVLGARGGNAADLLVAHPAAFIGVVLHHVRHEVLEGRWGGAGNPRRAALKIFAARQSKTWKLQLERDDVRPQAWCHCACP